MLASIDSDRAEQARWKATALRRRRSPVFRLNTPA